jgi:transposase
MNEMTPDTRPLSQQMLLDGMYSGIVEKWATEVAALEARIEETEAALRRMSQRWADGQARIEALEKERDKSKSIEEICRSWLVLGQGLLDEWWAVHLGQDPESYTVEGIALNELIGDTEAAILAAEEKPTDE